MDRVRKQAVERLSKSSRWSLLEYAYEKKTGTFRSVDINAMFQNLKREREYYIAKVKSFGTALDWHYIDALKTTIAGPTFDEGKFEHKVQVRFRRHSINQHMQREAVDAGT